MTRSTRRAASSRNLVRMQARILQLLSAAARSASSRSLVVLAGAAAPRQAPGSALRHICSGTASLVHDAQHPAQAWRHLRQHMLLCQQAHKLTLSKVSRTCARFDHSDSGVCCDAAAADVQCSCLTAPVFLPRLMDRRATSRHGRLQTATAQSASCTQSVGRPSCTQAWRGFGALVADCMMAARMV